MGSLIGEILRERSLVTQADLEEALLVTRQTKDKRLEEVLLERKVVSETAYLSAVAARVGLESVQEIALADLDADALGKLSLELLRSKRMVPLRCTNGEVRVATADPFDVHPLDDVRAALKQDVVPVISTPRAILGALNAYLDSQKDTASRAIQDLGTTGDAYAIEEFEASEDLLDVAKKAPIVKLVNSMIHEAIQDRASDIHVEPFEKQIKVRYRIDGILYDAHAPPRHVLQALVSRIKILSGLNIAESRMPQDGRMNVTVGDRKLDIRVSILPTAFGERVVMRLLDKSRTILNLTELGFAEAMLESFRKLVLSPYGIILVTGPTGSGKSTTLYSALTTIATSEKNIITVEDPIENQIKNVCQMQVKPQIGLSFAEGLRSILRQDPDIIMVGEIRDRETAEISVQASLTGHLVFSTLHTNDSAGAITRLIDMGVEPYLISSSVIGILAQRLVRVICPHCKQRTPLPDDLRQSYALAVAQVSHGAGCPECRQTGYRGRLGIFELLVVDDGIREMVTSRRPSGVIKGRCVDSGMVTLREDGMHKVETEVTTIEEVARVTQD